MSPSRRCFRVFALAMAAVMFWTAVPIHYAGAAMLGTEQVVEQAAAQDSRARVMAFLAREDVRRQLAALGVDAEEAERRAASLSEQEIQQIAGRLDRTPAGQSAVGVIVGAILLVLLVLLITDLLGLTDVFPFVKSQRTR